MATDSPMGPHTAAIHAGQEPDPTTGAVMQPAIIQLLRIHAPAGMDARAISYSSSFQFFAMGLAPFCAGLIGPALGLRAYFAVTVMLTLGGLLLWLRAERRKSSGVGV